MLCRKSVCRLNKQDWAKRVLHKMSLRNSTSQVLVSILMSVKLSRVPSYIRFCDRTRYMEQTSGTTWDAVLYVHVYGKCWRSAISDSSSSDIKFEHCACENTDSLPPKIWDVHSPNSFFHSSLHIKRQSSKHIWSSFSRRSGNATSRGSLPCWISFLIKLYGTHVHSYS